MKISKSIIITSRFQKDIDDWKIIKEYRASLILKSPSLFSSQDVACGLIVKNKI